ncbi:MAG: N-acetylneuraminate synthase family protein [Rhizobiaceae bacterium]
MKATTPSRQLQIGDRLIGEGHPAYLVAEIGTNHNGDLDLARKTIDAAKAAGADAVKFQNYHTDDFIADRTLTYTYDGKDGPVTENLYEMFKRVELGQEQLARISEHCAVTGIDWHSTPTSMSGVKTLTDLGVSVLKNGSDYLGDLDLIEGMGNTGLPVVLSSGMATMADIDDAVRCFRRTGNDQLILLQCTSQYPTPADEANIRRVRSLADAFGCLSGFSDHTAGIAASVAAVTLGAVWIEKHFTLDRSLPGPDHAFSSDPDEFAELAAALRFTEVALGQSAIVLSEREVGARTQHRLSCSAARNLAPGHRLAQADIRYVRPGSGIPPRDAHLILGRRLAKEVPAGRHILLDDLD